MGLFRDRRDRRDLSLKVCWTLAVWLMTQQLRCDVNEADEAEQRRLERHPESGHAGAVLAAARLASDGEHLANGLRVAHASPVVGTQTNKNVGFSIKPKAKTTTTTTTQGALKNVKKG